MVLSCSITIFVGYSITPITNLSVQKEPGIFIYRFLRCTVKCLYNYIHVDLCLRTCVGGCVYIYIPIPAIKRGNGKSPSKGWLGRTLSINGGFSIAMFDCQRVYCMLNIYIYIQNYIDNNRQEPSSNYEGLTFPSFWGQNLSTLGHPGQSAASACRTAPEASG